MLEMIYENQAILASRVLRLDTLIMSFYAYCKSKMCRTQKKKQCNNPYLNAYVYIVEHWTIFINDLGWEQDLLF